jgi:hypothetical protein
MHMLVHKCVHNLFSFILAGVMKIQLLDMACLIQCLVVCINHMREEFVRKTVDSVVVGGKCYWSYQVQCENVD